MLLGKVLALSALNKGYNISWFPSYGAEVRGGTAYCMVVISLGEIASPYIDEADSLIIMNEPSLFKFGERLKNKGLMLINSSLINNAKQKSTRKKAAQDTKGIYLPLTQTAIRLGNIRTANMVALGAYAAKKRIFRRGVIFKAIQEIAPPNRKNLIPINKQAIQEGMRLAR